MRRAVKSVLLVTVGLLLITGQPSSLFAAEKVLTIYDLGTDYMSWGKITRAYHEETNVRPTTDLKVGSSAALAALEIEKNNPQANGAYYSAA
ncbi:MAG: hypothetical protein AB1798_18775, partial [Spirochaetota bacterium]